MKTSFQQTWAMPAQPRPIVIIGGGDIVRDAHIPSYNKAGLPVAGVFDLNRERAEARVRELQGGGRVFDTLEQALATPNAVFDMATPPSQHVNVLSQLPDASSVLIQKPMGTTFDQAKAIVALCRKKRLTVAINFQLRFAPNMLAMRDIIRRGLIGDVIDIDMHMNVSTPWDQFPFLRDEERVEIVIHSVHYLDLIRSFIGDPRAVYARTVQHPDHQDLASTKSSIILDYGNLRRVCLSINHDFPYGGTREDAVFRVQGTEGAITTRLGISLDYPRGKRDILEVHLKGSDGWEEVPLVGGWFPDAFLGPMNNLQRVASGEDEALISPVEDALHTMAVVEACYTSDAKGGVPLPDTNIEQEAKGETS